MKKFKPLYWRSLAELENTPEFREFVEREFAAPLEHAPVNSPERRRFLELMGASFALAGVAGCRWQEDKLVPLTRRPEGIIPGVPRRFSTAMDLGGTAVGLHVTSYDGRPIKVDGNPNHPDSLGASFPYQQASVLGVYDPDRSEAVLQGGQPSSWAAFDEFAAGHFAAMRARGGAGLAVLSERTSSPTVAALRDRVLALFPQATWTTYEPLAADGARGGSVLAFGAPHRTHLSLERARVILSLDCDFMAPTFPGSLANARAFSRNHLPEGEMSRLYVIESGYSLAGGQADHRLALRSELIKAVAAYLDAEISAKANAAADLGRAQAKPAAAVLGEAGVQKFLDAVVKDLVGNLGASVIVAGPEQPAEVHALVHRLNALLGNVGRTVRYSADADAAAMSDVSALTALTASLGQVDTLLILGGNPAYTAPADVPFAQALGSVKTSIHLSLYVDETSSRCTWHLPAAHYLESWGDARAWNGTLSIAQPLIAPLYKGRSTIEVLAHVAGDKADARALVGRTHAALLGDERGFRKALHDGVVAGSAFAEVNPALKPLSAIAFSERELAGSKLANGAYELLFTTDGKVHDGRFANNGWLQELPGTFTKLSWDNAVLVPYSVAQELNLKDGNLADVSVNGQTIRLPAVVQPGQADGCLRVFLGYGRTHAGHVGGLAADEIAPVGANAYALRTSQAYHSAPGATLQPGGAPEERLATTQDLFVIDPLGREGTAERLDQIVREATLTEYKQHPQFAREKVHHPPLLNMWVPPVSYEGHRWGMSIDLNKCIGCNACVTACQAENNIPVTGRKPVSMGREMFWLRVDRYYKGEPDAAEVSFQPMPCQHCENAPCEQVCPVGATVHSSEGLNEMVYNRCIGTRYCSNNCPYKVRHFNYFNYNLDVIGMTPFTPTKDLKMKVKSMVFNPEVTVRSRGVMEKCTFCVQRIQNTKIVAKNEKRPIADGEIKTACQQTCPTEAIVFGDLNDPNALVRRQQNLPRSYELLGELNNRPRVQYLARIKNPNPELV